MKFSTSLFAVLALIVACSPAPQPPLAPPPPPVPAPVVATPCPTATPAPAPAPVAVLATPAPVVDAGVSVTPSTASVVNDGSTAKTIYASFGADSVVSPTTWKGFCTAQSNLTCSFLLGGKATQDLPTNGAYLNVTLSVGAPVGCGTTKAELNLNHVAPVPWYDVTDISLVDGWNAPMEMVVTDASGTKTLGPVKKRTGNEHAFGVYPLGCDICVQRQKPPCGIKPGPVNGDGCKAGSQYNPAVPCQYQGPTKSGGSNVVVHVGGA
jgi:hypothetical protein